MKSDEKALFKMKSDEKALFEMKSDEKALFEMKSDEKALSDEELRSFGVDEGGLDYCSRQRSSKNNTRVCR